VVDVIDVAGSWSLETVGLPTISTSLLVVTYPAWLAARVVVVVDVAGGGLADGLLIKRVPPGMILLSV
jgi:hypothetical protein